MEKFFYDLRTVLEKYNEDVTVLDDYEIESQFVQEIVKNYFEKENTQVLEIRDITVFDGPNVGSISISLSIRFDIKLLPDYKIEEQKKMNLFLKIPVFEEPIITSQRLCSKEVNVYDDFFKDLKEFHDHPIKGPYTAPVPKLIYHKKNSQSLLVLENVSEQGYYSPRERFLDKNELRSVLKGLAKFHADGIKFLNSKKDNNYQYLGVDEKRKLKIIKLLDKYLEPYLSFLEQFTPVQPAVLLLKEMSRNCNMHDVVFAEMENTEKQLLTVCHRYIRVKL